MEKEASPYAEGFIKRFGEFMAYHNLNTNRLANEVGESRVRFGRYVRGEALPNYEMLVLLADNYNISLDWLVRGQGSMKAGDTSAAPQNAAPINDEQLQALSQRLAQRERELDQMRLKNEMLQERLNEARQDYKQMVKEAMSFPTLDSYTPAYAQATPSAPTPARFEQGYMRNALTASFGQEAATDMPRKPFVAIERGNRFLSAGREREATA